MVFPPFPRDIDPVCNSALPCASFMPMYLAVSMCCHVCTLVGCPWCEGWSFDFLTAFLAYRFMAAVTSSCWKGYAVPLRLYRLRFTMSALAPSIMEGGWFASCMAARIWSWCCSRIAIVREARAPVPSSDPGRLRVVPGVWRELSRRWLEGLSERVVSAVGWSLPGTAEGMVIRGPVGVSSAGEILRLVGVNVTHITGPWGRSIGTGFVYRIALDRRHA